MDLRENELAAIIEKERFTDPEKSLAAAKELIKKLEDSDDSFMKGYAYYSAGEASFQLDDSEKGIAYMNVAEEELRDNLSGDFGVSHLLDIWGISDMLGSPNEKAGSIMDRVLNIMLHIAETANTDALTGLPNVREMYDIMGRYFERAMRTGTDIAFEMLDIDHFKTFNDTYGHDVGDFYLKALSKALSDMVERKSGRSKTANRPVMLEDGRKITKGVRAARRGGDEFAVFYYGFSEKEIIECSKMISENYKKNVKHGGNEAPEESTVSQGICLTKAADFEKPNDILRVADNALYYVKQNGNDGTALVKSQKEMDEGKDIRIYR